FACRCPGAAGRAGKLRVAQPTPGSAAGAAVSGERRPCAGSSRARGSLGAAGGHAEGAGGGPGRTGGCQAAPGSAARAGSGPRGIHAAPSVGHAVPVVPVVLAGDCLRGTASSLRYSGNGRRSGVTLANARGGAAATAVGSAE